MSDIKIKEKLRGTIKTLDKSAIASQKLKDNLVSLKDKSENTYVEDSNNSNYAQNKYTEAVNITTRKGINKFDEIGRKSYNETKQNIHRATEKIKAKKFKQKEAEHIADIKNIRNAKNTTNTISRTKGTLKNVPKKTEKTIKGVTKRSKRYVKTATKTTGKAIKTTENFAKTSEKAVKASIKTAQRTAKAVKAATKAAIRATKATVKAVIAAIKAIILAMKALIAFLLAGGWIIIVIILVICFIAMLISSVFGIFFSGEDLGDETKTLSAVVSEVNQEYINKINEILANEHEEYDITGNRADLKEVIAVYAVRTQNGNAQNMPMVLDENNVNLIKSIFWDMNEITHTKEEWTEKKVILHLTWTEHKTITHTKLHITVKSKTAAEMAEQYHFNDEQKQMLNELLKDEYLDMWNSAIYGTSTGDSNIVAVAASQIGNVGGQPYWSWYGFKNRVEWCACFVSWCANECGYIDAGKIPKFAGCQAEGVAWFKALGLWKDGGYIPKAGDIIFFDWADKNDEQAEHVGIVEKVENGRVHTIEGNTSDSCARMNYDLNSTEILGYGTPMY